MPLATISAPSSSRAAAALAAGGHAPAGTAQPGASAPAQGFADLVDVVVAEPVVTAGGPAGGAVVPDLATAPIPAPASNEPRASLPVPLPVTPQALPSGAVLADAMTSEAAIAPPELPPQPAAASKPTPETPAPAEPVRPIEVRTVADAQSPAIPVLVVDAAATPLTPKLKASADPIAKDGDEAGGKDTGSALALATPLADPAPLVPPAAAATPQPQVAPVAVQVAAAIPSQPAEEFAASAPQVDPSQPLAGDTAPAASHAGLRTTALAEIPTPVSADADGLTAPLFSQALGQQVQPGPILAGMAYAPGKAAPASAMVRARAGQMGRDMGAVISRHVVEGRDQVTVRLTPPEMGRVDVRLSFDHAKGLRAIVATESPAAMDLLRRDMGDLNRALADAGIRTDADSFRFDSRSSGGGFAQPDHSRQNPQGQSSAPFRTARGDLSADPSAERAWRPLRASGGIDMIA
ncbi:hypothetical protein HL653_06205 [Sphingomonas sp. AP4-R1]|uniref:flagellar hook-length control protein FliK n=1 Tax=Sphingomonas sp. AP4-R1 TaxID=2735134 RepID=UPI001493DCAE|nr:flagellar hook-length control protein FliK [Sphingomonas sp. AP4-R1]QJU57438.1 hypothetical protein HL653_06205 [Sphingomonas sp. AP4-R1]